MSLLLATQITAVATAVLAFLRDRHRMFRVPGVA
jgi:hypothetical protein